MSGYFRPLVRHGAARPDDAVALAGGPLWFAEVEVLARDAPPRLIAPADVPGEVLARLTAPRAPVAGLEMSRPRLMGILNVTPDSFSDGGRHGAPGAALSAALAMVAAGADLIDVGGESTRPGAAVVPVADEIARTAPVIAALRGVSEVPISVDTRKSAVARAALAAGASMVNDVAGFTYDTDLAPLCADAGVPVCVMHAKGDPATMQDAPRYDDVLADVCDFLEERVRYLESLGIPRARIIVDPGLGFGKTQAHNLTLLQNISLFHGLGCAILLGASRKRFIGTIGKEPRADARAPGSIAVGLAALAQGVQILRIHDVVETAQAVRLWSAIR